MPESAKKSRSRVARQVQWAEVLYWPETLIVEHGLTPTLAIDTLSVSDRDGQSILTAPKAEISVDPFALMVGNVVPKRLEVFDVTVRMVLFEEREPRRRGRERR